MNEKQYKIVINGVSESIDAVASLNKQLSELESRMKDIEQRQVKVSTSSSSGSGSKSSAKNLSSEEQMLRKINKLEDDRITASKEIYQNYLAAKDVLKQTQKAQEEAAAKERLKANAYGGNTMQGMKDRLADIKRVMQTTDVDSDIFQKYTEEANVLTNKLKDLEAKYGQFGRNVGNYKSASDGFKGLQIEVNGVTRSFENATQAYRTLKRERDTMALSGNRETKEFKELDETVRQLGSDIKDLEKSSATMDGLLDTMETFAALGSVGMGITNLLGLNNDEIGESIQKITALLLALKGLETINKQWKSGDSPILNVFKGLDASISKTINKIFGVNTALKIVGVTAQWLGRVFMAAFSMGVLWVFTEIVEKIGEFIKGLNTAKIKADQLTEELNAVNKAIEYKNELLASQYLKQEIDDAQYLEGVYANQAEQLSKQLELIQKIGKEQQNNANSNWLGLNQTENGEFTGDHISMPRTIGTGNLNKLALNFDSTDKDLQITVKNIEEVEKAWNNCVEAIKNGKDYLSYTGEGTWIDKLLVTVNDTKEAMRGLGNIKLSDFVGSFNDLNEDFKRGKISAEQYAQGIGKLRKEMNSNDILNSVIANLPKYIKDDEFRNKVENIIAQIVRLDDAFNMTSPEQIHYWNQVRIDGMKDGIKKEIATIDEAERYEIEQHGKTLEQIGLINAKYERQRERARKNASTKSSKSTKDDAKKLYDLEYQFRLMQLNNLKNSLDKQLKIIELNKQKELKETADKLKELKVYNEQWHKWEHEITVKYDKMILDEKKKWAYDYVHIYEDLANSIKQFNDETYNMEGTNAEDNVSNRTAANKRSAANNTITPSTYDDPNALASYYEQVLKIEEAAANRMKAIREEDLLNQKEVAEREEEIRHNKLIDANGGEYAKQLEAGVITQEQYDKLIEDENDAHEARMRAIDRTYQVGLSSSTETTLQEVEGIYSNYYQNIGNVISNEKSKIDKVANADFSRNAFGIVNIAKSSKDIKDAMKGYDDLKAQIVAKKAQLKEDLDNKKISGEEFGIQQKELDQQIQGIDESRKQLAEKSKNLIGEFVASFAPYMQGVADLAQNILSAVWNAEDAAIEKEKEALEKRVEEIDKIYDKMDERAQEHRDNMNSLEDEIASAQGDARDRLIQRYNAEKAAEKEALKEKKKAEKEKEKLQEKQEKLDQEQREKQRERDLIQAAINTAMAISFAAMNPWPVPAVPMMALAAATGAAQIAAINAKKYATGGVLEGKSHAQGGVKVLGGMAEVEGGEYITNRVTTQNNVDVLDFINSNRRKLDISDFVDFFSSKSQGNVIRNSSPHRIFADGGQLPTMRDDISVDSAVLSAIDRYSNKPTIVSVVDIIDRTADVNSVKVMAGL